MGSARGGRDPARGRWGARRGPTAKAVATAACVVAATAAGLAAGCRPARPGDGGGADVVDYLSARGGDAGFARASGPGPIRFPADEGPHPEYQTEWWYYTGNLAAADGGRRFGFQLTFFRRALAPDAGGTARPSRWAASQAYLAHFTVTDVAAGRFHSAERLARGGAGLAGAAADPFEVWVESWSAGLARGPGPAVAVPASTARRPDAGMPAPSARRGVADSDGFSGPVRLAAADGPVAIDLELRPAKPPALHGDAGYSRKGPEPGNASYYYSYTRLGATGTVTTADGAFAVRGLAWMDHEWSTSALAPSQVGWDWFSLQLEDGRELMAFQLRERGGGIAPESSGSLVDRDGAVTPLGREDFAIVPTGRWTSPRSGGEYPSGWRLTVPAAGLDLAVAPLVRDQELDVGFKYWEGAVRVSGTRDGAPVAGHGYVELTGYAAGTAGGLPGTD